MQLSEYKKGDRVKYIFLGDYDGVVTDTHKKHGSPFISIRLDNRPPIEFNCGHINVLALSPKYLELI